MCVVECKTGFFRVMKYGRMHCHAHLICPPHYYHNYSKDAYEQIILDSCAACPVGYDNVYGLGANCTSCDLDLINYASGTPCQRCAADSFLHKDLVLQQVLRPYPLIPFTHIRCVHIGPFQISPGIALPPPPPPPAQRPLVGPPIIGFRHKGGVEENEA